MKTNRNSRIWTETNSIFLRQEKKKKLFFCFSWMRREKLWVVKIVEQTHEQSRVFGFVLLRMMRLLIKCHRSNARELPVWDVNNDEFNRFFVRLTDARIRTHRQIEFRPQIRIWFTFVGIFFFYFDWQMSATHMCQLILGFVSQFSNSNRKWQFAGGVERNFVRYRTPTESKKIVSAVKR